MFLLMKHTNSEYRKLEFERKQRAKIADFDVWIVAPEDLTISKIEWIQQHQSDKQINDIQNLIAIPELDKEYIITWCNKLKLNTFNLIDNA